MKNTKQSTPLVTVLLPCYNAMPYLIESIESMLCQTYSNLEILCINDGSTDESGKILDQYALKDSRVRVIHNETNIKLIRSLNKGIELARGEYIARMDADDISHPKRIEVEIKYLLDNPDADVVGCGIFVINEKGATIKSPIIRQQSTKANLFASFLFVPLGHSELLFRTSVLKNNLYLTGEFAIHTEDYELWTRLLRAGYQLRNIEPRLHYFRKNPDSVSWKYANIQNENFIECAYQHWKAYSGTEIDKEIMHVVANRFSDKITPTILRKGYHQIRYIKKYFYDKEGPNLSRLEKKEIFIVFKTHLLDVLTQSLKKAPLLTKPLAIYYLLMNADMVFCKKTWKYIFSKF